MQVLFEDNHCLAVVKPAGVPVQADESGDRPLLETVRAYLKEKYQKPGDAFVGLVHRLDRPVGGVLVFAKTSKGASRLSEQVREHRLRKVYWAVVEGAPRVAAGTVVQWLAKDERTNVVTAYDAPHGDAKRSELAYRTLRSEGGFSLVEIELKTGRSHQIRLAMKSLGCPIYGDLKYGAHHPWHHNIALFARSLTFKKPVGDEQVTVTAEPDWEFFRQ